MNEFAAGVGVLEGFLFFMGIVLAVLAIVIVATVLIVIATACQIAVHVRAVSAAHPAQAHLAH
jgi:uncharacterized membrane protein